MEQDKIPDPNAKKEEGQKNDPVKDPSPSEGVKSKQERNKSENTGKDTKKEKDNRLSWGRKFFEPSALWQFITVVITAITLIWVVSSTNRQFDTTEKALAKSDSLTRISLKLTQKADSISEQALIHSVKSDSTDSIMTIKDTLARERNTKRELRAYIVITKFSFITVKKDIIAWMVEVINTGKTPAYKMTGASNYKPGGTGVYDKEMKEIKTSDNPVYFRMQGNGINDTLMFGGYGNLNITDEKIAKIKRGDMTLYIYGYITYFDVFGGKHKTRFCYESLPELNSQIIFTRYPRYNDGD